MATERSTKRWLRNASASDFGIVYIRTVAPRSRCSSTPSEKYGSRKRTVRILGEVILGFQSLAPMAIQVLRGI